MKFQDDESRVKRESFETHNREEFPFMESEVTPCFFPCKNVDVVKGKSRRCCIVYFNEMTFQDEENRGKRESFEKDNIVGMEDEEFPVYMQAVKDPSSYDDHIWDDTIPINGDLNPDQQGDHDPLNG